MFGIHLPNADAVDHIFVAVIARYSSQVLILFMSSIGDDIGGFKLDKFQVIARGRVHRI
jgi:hypothetical protein